MTEPQRNRYLQYLPAIFRRPSDENEPVLAQFLAPFEQQFVDFEYLLDKVDQNLSASLAPAADFLPWLAGWVGHSFDEGWEEDRRRRFLAAAMELYRWRGTASGLKRYLKLGLDLDPDEVDIREGRWPGGMQIGVSSRIGYDANNAAHEPNGAGARKPGIDATSHTYYVVDTVTPTDLPAVIAGESIAPGERIQLYYDATYVHRIELKPDGVRLDYVERNTTGEGRALTPRPFFHRRPSEDSHDPAKPNIQRRGGLIDYHISPADKAPSVIAGGTLLVSELERPYCFILDICRAFTEPAGTEQTEAKMSKAMEAEIEKLGRKVCALLDAEKPAHTEYIVRIRPAAGRPSPNFMQIGEHSSIGLDTTVG
jgi:phage tail-like protein